ncbi:carbohydrate esterase family 16 protein [Botryobasidium botryosum FD-172 SS1]|uniref:Carbohydrate esterase family 16 protein n=1 Tax=Botryobasidium botryosum (strain FD-172 SS1) TaxID=930990 RepID=A0A067M108_BOTB1|nr:carbohydrate esterase family 16 protein [Botryobasidium botryosum FD-172 SS1]
MVTPPCNYVRASWPGFGGLRYLFVFGASYCDVGFTMAKDTPAPTDDNPLGIEYPGVTYAEEGKPNWVGFLATVYNASPLLVYNYALGGATVDGVANQVERSFLPRAGTKPAGAVWTERDSLFITWVGINDIARGASAHDSLDRLFAAQAKLYAAGARNFMFVEMPPIHRSPAIPEARSNASGAGPFEAWNASLAAHIEEFATDYPDTSVFLFKAWDTFTRVLDDPVAHGFKTGDTRRKGGGIWVDQLHPTSAMHEVVAQDMAIFLDGVGKPQLAPLT